MAGKMDRWQSRIAVLGVLGAAWLAGVAPARAEERPQLSGDWNGARTRLAQRGISLDIGYGGEAAHNFTGGTRRLTRYADQFALGATADLGTLWGWHGATFQVTYTARNGRDLGADAQIGNYQLIQEVYGRGQTVHLTDFWLEQAFLDGRLQWKLGRVTVGEDFANFACDFQNLTFCGSQPGNLVGDYWVNWPTSQWGTRLKLATSPRTYLQLGAYQVNPHYVDDQWARRNGWKLNNPGGTLGGLFPVEFGWTPAWRGLPGSYKLGAWYSSAGGDDVLLDIHREPRILTGAPALQRDARYGGYLNFQQQLGGVADTSGTSVFLNITQADRRTAATDRQVSAGMEYRGPFGRAGDMVGFALGATHTNNRLAHATRLFNAAHPGAGLPVKGSEYAGEVFYSWSPAPWVSLRPNLQYLVHPGGNRQNHDALVVGMKTSVAF